MAISFCPIGGESYNLAPGQVCPVHGATLESIVQMAMLDIIGTRSTWNGLVLALVGEGDPIGLATDYLTNQGFTHGDMIAVKGDRQLLGAVSVLFIDSVQRG